MQTVFSVDTMVVSNSSNRKRGGESLNSDDPFDEQARHLAEVLRTAGYTDLTVQTVHIQIFFGSSVATGFVSLNSDDPLDSQAERLTEVLWTAGYSDFTVELTFGAIVATAHSADRDLINELSEELEPEVKDDYNWFSVLD